jgi:hypothetical protein
MDPLGLRERESEIKERKEDREKRGRRARKMEIMCWQFCYRKQRYPINQ